MTDYTKDELINALCCDVQVDFIEWSNEGRDLRIGLVMLDNEMETGSISRRVILARWVRGLKIDLRYRDDAGGYPMTWDVEADELQSGELFVRFDFADVGEMTFECSELLWGLGDEEQGSNS